MKTLLLILATALNLFAAEDGSVLVYNGVSNSALATNVFKVTGGTNASLAGDLNLHNVNATGSVTAASLTLPGASPAAIALNAGGTIENGGGDFALTNNTPVHFQSNIVINSTITDSAGSVGTSGQVLKSGGAGAGTTWGGAGGYALTGGSSASAMTDSVTYYIGFTFSAPAQTQGSRGIPVLKAGTITAYYVSVSGTAGTAENVTIDVWVSNSTSVGSHTETWDAVPKRTVTTGLSQAVTTSDYIELRVQTPGWVTNPSNISIGFAVLIE